MTDLPDAYLTEADFCARYHVKARTAQRWRVTGEGPAFVRIGPRRIAYRLSDCESWAAGRTYQRRSAEVAAIEHDADAVAETANPRTTTA